MPERVSGPPPLMLPGAALLSFAARFCWQGQHFRLWTVPERVSGPPPSMLPGAALLSLAARFCWQGQHFRLWTVPERVSGPPPLMLPGAALLSLAARFCWQGQHFRLWTVPERVRGPPLDAARRSTLEPRGSFLLAGAALQPPSLILPGAALGSLAAQVLESLLLAHAHSHNSNWEPAGRFCHRCQHLLLNVVASLRGFWFLLQPEFCEQYIEAIC